MKVLNRISRIPCVPAPQVAIDRFLSEHYPGDGWKALSPLARQLWVQYSVIVRRYEIRTLAYIGANDGTVALAFDEAFPGLQFYLVEPVPETFRELSHRTVHRANMRCFHVAAGEAEGSSVIHIDSFRPASSLLPYERLALEEFPFLGRVRQAELFVKPLDDLLTGCGAAGRVDMLIIDVQGYEDHVIRGATQTLRSCRTVVSELSLQSLYVGSSTFDSVYRALVDRGFRLRYLLNPLEGQSHHILQIDGVFVREPPDA